MAKNNQIYWIIGIIILAVIILPKLDIGLFAVGEALANPAAVFCQVQGYDYEIREVNGQQGICKSTFIECDEWVYYAKCKPEGWESYIPLSSYTQEELDACKLSCIISEESEVCCKITPTIPSPIYAWTTEEYCDGANREIVSDEFCEIQEEKCLFKINEFCIKLWMLLTVIGIIILIAIASKK